MTLFFHLEMGAISTILIEFDLRVKGKICICGTCRSIANDGPVIIRDKRFLAEEF